MLKSECEVCCGQRKEKKMDKWKTKTRTSYRMNELLKK